MASESLLGTIAPKLKEPMFYEFAERDVNDPKIADGR
jgi:hypothetical protein